MRMCVPALNWRLSSLNGPDPCLLVAVLRGPTATIFDSIRCMTTPRASVLGSPRAAAAWALVGYAALFLFFQFFQWILPGGGLSERSAHAQFTNPLVMAMPVLATLLAVHVQPMLAGARLISAIALIDYAVSLFFGAITLLIGLPAVFDGISQARDAMNALAYLVLGVGGLVLIAIAAWVVLQAFQALGGRLPGRTPTTTPPPTA
jgi:hypothetical protein